MADVVVVNTELNQLLLFGKQNLTQHVSASNFVDKAGII
jgi:hypothetical protein